MADKSGVLAFLRAHPDWISAAALRSAVGSVPDRTLRNWLRDLAKDGAIESRGERKGRRYRRRPASIAGPAGLMVPAARSIFSPDSEELIQRIQAPIYTRPPASGDR